MPLRPNPEANATSQKAPLVSGKKSDFQWGFEEHVGYPFVGMSAPTGQIMVHLFQSQGYNRTKDPIVTVRSYVRSDRTNKEYPIFFNVGGNDYNIEQINPIPVDALFNVRGYFSEDKAPVPLQKFLAEIAPLTFFFEYDGRQYRRTFALSDIEPLVKQYEEDVRKASVKPPQVSVKTQTKQSHIYTEREIRDLLDALSDAQKMLDNDMAPVFQKIEMVSLNGLNMIPNVGTKGLVAELRELREKLQKDIWPKLNEFVYTTHVRYKDLMRSAFALDHPAARGDITRALDTAIEAVGLLPDNPESKTIGLVKPQLAEVAQLAQSSYTWLGSARTNIENMTKTLRTSNVTGYEKN